MGNFVMFILLQMIINLAASRHGTIVPNSNDSSLQMHLLNLNVFVEDVRDATEITSIALNDTNYYYEFQYINAAIHSSIADGRKVLYVISNQSISDSASDQFAPRFVLQNFLYYPVLTTVRAITGSKPKLKGNPEDSAIGIQKSLDQSNKVDNKVAHLVNAGDWKLSQNSENYEKEDATQDYTKTTYEEVLEIPVTSADSLAPEYVSQGSQVTSLYEESILHSMINSTSPSLHSTIPEPTFADLPKASGEVLATESTPSVSKSSDSDSTESVLSEPLVLETTSISLLQSTRSEQKLIDSIISSHDRVTNEDASLMHTTLVITARNALDNNDADLVQSSKNEDRIHISVSGDISTTEPTERALELPHHTLRPVGTTSPHKTHKSSAKSLISSVTPSGSDFSNMLPTPAEISVSETKSENAYHVSPSTNYTALSTESHYVASDSTMNILESRLSNYAEGTFSMPESSIAQDTATHLSESVPFSSTKKTLNTLVFHMAPDVPESRLFSYAGNNRSSSESHYIAPDSTTNLLELTNHNKTGETVSPVQAISNKNEVMDEETNQNQIETTAELVHISNIDHKNQSQLKKSTETSKKVQNTKKFKNVKHGKKSSDRQKLKTTSSVRTSTKTASESTTQSTAARAGKTSVSQQPPHYNGHIMQKGVQLSGDGKIYVNDRNLTELRSLLTNLTKLEHKVVMSNRDHGSSFIRPILKLVNYDNTTIPTAFSDIPIHVRVLLNIIHLSSFDTQKMDYAVDIEMEMRWFDIRLANNYTRWIRIWEKQILEQIWRPDPYFVNSKHSYFHKVSFPNFRMYISPEGLVVYNMRVTLQPSCQMIFCRFPHDRQECDLMISSISFPHTSIRFSWHSSTPVKFVTAVSLPELKIRSIMTKTCQVENKLVNSSCLRLVFKLERGGTRFIVEKYIPSTVAMMFAWIAPYVPYYYEEVRIITPVTVLLTLVQMEKGEQEIRTSYLTSIDTWFGAMKAFSAISLIESMLVLALIKRSRAKTLQSMKAKTQFERERLIDDQKRLTWLYHRLDTFARFATPLAFLLFFLYYITYIVQADEESCDTNVL